MPSFQDSAVLVILALLLFGPKGMVKLGRELGKLLAEFRRASNDFRIQMDDEFRAEEQAEQQRKITAMAAPVSPAAPLIPFAADTPGAMPLALAAAADETSPGLIARSEGAAETASAPHPIASSGSLHLMPPATGLPLERSPFPVDVAASLNGAFDSVPHGADPQLPHPHTNEEFPLAHPHHQDPMPAPEPGTQPVTTHDASHALGHVPELHAPELLEETARHG